MGKPSVHIETSIVSYLAADPSLWRGVPMPAPAYIDAMHIALSAVHGMAYVLTWDGKHIANPRLQARISQICLAWGCTKPVLCTPAEFK